MARDRFGRHISSRQNNLNLENKLDIIADLLKQNIKAVNSLVDVMNVAIKISNENRSKNK